MQTNNHLQKCLLVGIDPHKQTHTLTALTPFGQRVGSVTFANAVPGFKQALKTVNQLAKQHQLQPLIGIEGAGGHSTACARYFYLQGLSVKAVPPIMVQRQALDNTHPEKSDSQDAEEVARALLTKSGRLPDYIVSQASDFAKDLNLLVKDREELVNEQTRLKNKLHAALQTSWGSEYKTVYQKNIFGIRALEFWLLFPSVVDFKKTTSTKYHKPDYLKNCSVDELPSVSDIHRQHVKRIVSRLLALRTEIRYLEQCLTEQVAQHCAYFISLPGCGSVTAAKLYAELNDVNRFASESKLARYSGIAPRKFESGSRKKDIQSKRGNVRLRAAVKTIALSQIGRRGHQLGKTYYRKKLKEGKTKKQALRCLMRQLTKIIFDMAVEQRPYY